LSCLNKPIKSGRSLKGLVLLLVTRVLATRNVHHKCATVYLEDLLYHIRIYFN